MALVAELAEDLLHMVGLQEIQALETDGMEGSGFEVSSWDIRKTDYSMLLVGAL